MNILIKLMSIVSLVIAPYIAVVGNEGGAGKCEMGKSDCCKKEMMMGSKCDMSKCMDMSKEECAAYCDSMKCTPEEKAMCLEHAGKASASSCMEGCENGCKTKEECAAKCGESCAKMHKE